MPALLEHFNNDFIDLSIDQKLTTTIENKDIQIVERIRLNHDSSARIFTYYIPEHKDIFSLIMSVLHHIKNRTQEVDGFIGIAAKGGDILVGEKKHINSNRIFFYVETDLDQNEVEKLDKVAKSSGLLFTIRGSQYLQRIKELDTPLAFISHDSKDKELIARPIAKGLSSRLCTVWFDEYSLKVGDSLRESIEDGIKKAKKCVLILTKNFLSNPGWTKMEFSSIFTREMVFNERIILPIWYGVTKEEIYNYSPSLADTVALSWPPSENRSEESYKQEVQKLISKIHVEVKTDITGKN